MLQVQYPPGLPFYSTELPLAKIKTRALRFSIKTREAT